MRIIGIIQLEGPGMLRTNKESLYSLFRTIDLHEEDTPDFSQEEVDYLADLIKKDLEKE